jgi:hypothetical protein
MKLNICYPNYSNLKRKPDNRPDYEKKAEIKSAFHTGRAGFVHNAFNCFRASTREGVSSR